MMKLLLIALLLAIITQASANCTSRRVCVRTPYYNRTCSFKYKRVPQVIKQRIAVYRNHCTNQTRSRPYCSFVTRRATKCVKVRVPRTYYVTRTLKSAYHIRVCNTTTGDKSYWNYSKCTKCSKVTKYFTRRVRERKCKYVLSPRCSSHHVRSRVCKTHYFHVPVCEVRLAGHRTLSKTVYLLSEVLQCSSQLRFKDSFKIVKQCKPCDGVPTYYNNKIFYRSSEQARARALQRCRNADLFTFYSCVFDRANGELNAKKEAERVRIYSRRTKGVVKCASFGDPHIRTFSGRVVNVYNHKANNQLLYQARDITVRTSYGFSRWGTRAVNRHATVQLGRSFATFVLPSRTRYGKFNWVSAYSGHGFTLVRHCDASRHYRARYADHTFDVIIHGRGYIDVHVAAPIHYAAAAKGQCNFSVKGNLITPESVYGLKFASACERKRTRYNACKAQCRSPSEILKCMQDAA